MDFDPVNLIAKWLEELLLSWNVSADGVNFVLTFIGAFVVAGLVLLVFIVQTWAERKLAARFQDRIGPNRVGPYGLLQPIADALKMVTKEDTTPANADKVAYNIAPVLSIFSVIMVWAVVPFTADWIGADINVGVLYIAAVGSFGILSVLMAGWSSNNKYALLGAFRGVAQMISYEVPLFLALLVPVLLARSMNISEIVGAQEGVLNWFALSAPIAVVIFFISSLAEVGRAPFDLLEAESEIVAGYHVEYSGMKFGLFQAGEFLHSFTAGALMGILFFGGWQGPADQFPLVGLIWFLLKTFVFYFAIIWSRMTFPRVRIDQIMALNWKFMVPLSLILLMGMPLIDFFTKGSETVVRVGSFFGFNLVLGFLALEYARRTLKSTPKKRPRFPERPVAVPPKEEAAAEA